MSLKNCPQIFLASLASFPSLPPLVLFLLLLPLLAVFPCTADAATPDARDLAWARCEDALRAMRACTSVAFRDVYANRLIGGQSKIARGETVVLAAKTQDGRIVEGAYDRSYSSKMDGHEQSDRYTTYYIDAQIYADRKQGKNVYPKTKGPYTVLLFGPDEEYDIGRDDLLRASVQKDGGVTLEIAGGPDKVMGMHTLETCTIEIALDPQGRISRFFAKGTYTGFDGSKWAFENTRTYTGYDNVAVKRPDDLDTYEPSNSPLFR